MISKKKLLQHLQDYSAQEIAEAVRNGIVTKYELAKKTEGAFTPLLRKQVEDILSNEPVAEVSQREVITTDASKSEVKEESIPDTEDIPLAIPAIPVTSFGSLTDSEPVNIDVNNSKEENDVVEGNQGMFSRPFSFNGRIRRLEYFISYILTIVYSYTVAYIVYSNATDYSAAQIAYWILSIPNLWFLYAQGAKRCHDRDNSGWYQIIPFYIFWMLFASGDDGENSYGLSPKQ